MKTHENTVGSWLKSVDNVSEKQRNRSFFPTLTCGAFVFSVVSAPPPSSSRLPLATNQLPPTNCHPPIATHQLPPTNCHQPIATNQLSPTNCHRNPIFCGIFFSNVFRDFFPGSVVFEEGRKEGRKQVSKEGRKEGRKEVSKEGPKNPKSKIEGSSCFSCWGTAEVTAEAPFVRALPGKFFFCVCKYYFDIRAYKYTRIR